MTLGFYRSQAALCFRIARSHPQERLANELLRLAAEFEGQAAELDCVGQGAEAGDAMGPAFGPVELGSRGMELLPPDY